MRSVFVRVPPELAELAFAGRTVAAHWRWMVAHAGATWTEPGPGVTVLDGSWLGTTPQALAHWVEGGPAPEGPPMPPWVAEPLVIAALVEALAIRGVVIHGAERVWVASTVEVAPGATLWGGCVLRGQTRIAAGAVVHPGVVLDDTTVGEGAEVKAYSVCEGATIGPECAVGPMAHLRPGAVLARDVKVGNFVEVKNTTLHPGVRASHLTYLGDAEVFDGANIGAGTITCNYDGFGKHRTRIGAGAFIGSNSSLVAPITIGDGAIVGAGSTVSRDVPADALMVERADERVLEGKAPRVHARNRQRAGK